MRFIEFVEAFARVADKALSTPKVAVNDAESNSEQVSKSVKNALRKSFSSDFFKPAEKLPSIQNLPVNTAIEESANDMLISPNFLTTNEEPTQQAKVKHDSFAKQEQEDI